MKKPAMNSLRATLLGALTLAAAAPKLGQHG
jgi:hypothetical protein